MGDHFFSSPAAGQLGLVVVLVALTIAMAGCVTIPANYRPHTSQISEPPVDAIVTVNVGGTILRRGLFAVHNAVLLHADIRLGTPGLWGYTLKRGYYVRVGEVGPWDFYQPSRTEGGAIVRGVLSDPPKAVLVDGRRLCVITIVGQSVCAAGADFEQTKQALATAGSFQQMLIYRGRDGDTIRVEYRELSGELEREAVRSDVEYDLKEARVLEYKGARIEVQDAGHEYIRYRVLQGFSPSN